jgi:tetraacyldisaccharide 4'-kinase
MSLLDAIYGVVVRTKNALHERGTLRARRLQGRVISVGNLAVGGSGKTPFVIMLGELLKARGVEFDVLSRGRRACYWLIRMEHHRSLGMSLC